MSASIPTSTGGTPTVSHLDKAREHLREHPMRSGQGVYPPTDRELLLAQTYAAVATAEALNALADNVESLIDLLRERPPAPAAEPRDDRVDPRCPRCDHVLYEHAPIGCTYMLDGQRCPCPATATAPTTQGETQS